jgi:cobalt/nickel transport system permease protein
VKTIALLAFLVALATTPVMSWPIMAGYGLLAALAVVAAGLPMGALLLRAAVVLPLAGTFALISAISGDAARAWALLGKSYISAVAALALAGSTPLPHLLRGMETMGTPRLLVLVVLFIHRYLFVISEQVQHMRLAAACRGRFSRGAATGALSVLFARSYGRAEAIHHAMLARGFTGSFPLTAPPKVRAADWAFLAAAVLTVTAIRLTLGVIH